MPTLFIALGSKGAHLLFTEKEISNCIAQLKRLGLPMLRGKQTRAFATKISDHAYIIETGHIRHEETMADLVKWLEVKEKYLMIEKIFTTYRPSTG